MPSGAFSHRDTFRALGRLIVERQVVSTESTLSAIAELMAFRHVATKIYGFLIDEAKLDVIVARINTEHTSIMLIVRRLLESV